jgi:ribosomal protein S18 acetylase RimI-like enzyme
LVGYTIYDLRFTIYCFFTIYYSLFTTFHMTSPILELSEPPTAEDSRLLLDGVRSFNRDRTGNEGPRTVAYFLRDEQRRIVGGVQGMLWGRSLHIDVLWVDEAYRGQGHGSKLMTAIENYGVEHGPLLAYLETASFQALPFYEGLGYRVFGELPEISEGETLFFLSKALTSDL